MGNIVISKFTIFIDHKDGLLLFNSFNGQKALCFKKEYQEILTKLREGKVMRTEDVPESIRLFCCEENLDEYKLAIDWFNIANNNKKVLSFIIVPTMACNFRCMYCYEELTDFVIDQEFISNFFASIVDYHNDNSLEQINIEWYGGEPLLVYDKIIAFTKELNYWCDKEGISYSYSATTNGYDLTIDRYEQLCELGFSRFTVTVDGFEEIHDKYRQHKSGEGTWRRISNNLHLIDESPVKCDILLRANYNFELLSDIESYTKYLHRTYTSDKFVFFFYPIKHWGNPNDNIIDIVDPSAYREATNIVLGSMNNANISPYFYNEKLDFAANICYAAKRFHFVLNTDGKLYKCSFIDLGASHNCVGDISSGKFTLHYDKNANYCIPDYASMATTGCFQCSIFPLCFGQSCPNHNILTRKVKCLRDAIDIEEVIVNEYEYTRKQRLTEISSK